MIRNGSGGEGIGGVALIHLFRHPPGLLKRRNMRTTTGNGYSVRGIGKNNGIVSWADTGNTADIGQVVLGTFDKVDQPVKSCPPYLSRVLKLYRGPSCSHAHCNILSPMLHYD